MKRTKTLLALLLALAMAFTLALPAMAASRKRNDIKITVTGHEKFLPFGSPFTLRVSVDMPDGVEIESYQWGMWYGGFGGLEGETDSVLHAAPGDDIYPNAYKPYLYSGQRYHCVVTFVEKDASGNVIDTFTKVSEEIRVGIDPERNATVWEALKDSAKTGLFLAGETSYQSFFLLLPLSPITFLVGFCIGLYSHLFHSYRIIFDMSAHFDTP